MTFEDILLFEILKRAEIEGAHSEGFDITDFGNEVKYREEEDWIKAKAKRVKDIKHLARESAIEVTKEMAIHFLICRILKPKTAWQTLNIWKY